MKQKTVESLLLEYRKSIADEIAQWKHINKNGCSDPFWSDGCNMNLIRNHIIYYKNVIMQICTENNLTLPEEYYSPLPPKVGNNYMANLKQKERINRLKQFGSELTTRRIEYDEQQLSPF